jgi:hypothetical protein
LGGHWGVRCLCYCNIFIPHFHRWARNHHSVSKRFIDRQAAAPIGDRAGTSPVKPDNFSYLSAFHHLSHLFLASYLLSYEARGLVVYVTSENGDKSVAVCAQNKSLCSPIFHPSVAIVLRFCLLTPFSSHLNPIARLRRH